jgi:hypothetical protein
MPLPASGTLLVIAPAQASGAPSLPPYSARGLTQTLELIDTAPPRRTINGELDGETPAAFRKYRSTITCEDLRAPALDGAYRGQAVVVDCVAELSYPSGGSAGRPVVPDSERTEGGFVFYRPRLQMRVIDIRVSYSEWDAEYSWQIDLEEI